MTKSEERPAPKAPARPHDLPLQAKVLTVSDRIVFGHREDVTGPILVEKLEAAGFEVIELRAVEDGVESVSNALSHMAYDFWGCIVTNGGTGFGPRDRTPEATERVLDRRATGMVYALVSAAESSRLSRAEAGTRGRALILNVSGKPSAAVDMLSATIDYLEHALMLMRGEGITAETIT